MTFNTFLKRICIYESSNISSEISIPRHFVAYIFSSFGFIQFRSQEQTSASYQLLIATHVEAIK